MAKVGGASGRAYRNRFSGGWMTPGTPITPDHKKCPQSERKARKNKRISSTNSSGSSSAAKWPPQDISVHRVAVGTPVAPAPPARSRTCSIPACGLTDHSNRRHLYGSVCRENGCERREGGACNASAATTSPLHQKSRPVPLREEKHEGRHVGIVTRAPASAEKNENTGRKSQVENREES